MSANDIEVGALVDAEAAGAVLARVELLRREFRFVMRVGEKLQEAIQAEEKLGMDVAAAQFEEMQWAAKSAGARIVAELRRINAGLPA